VNLKDPLEHTPWSHKRWTYSIGLVFLAQVVLVVLMTEQSQPAKPPPRFRTRINLAVDPSSQQQLADMAALSDPTLFALPNLHGFSGAAWLTFAPLEHHFTDWRESERWLEMDISSLGKSFLSFVETNTPAPLLIADKPLPAPPGPNLRWTNGPLATRSEVRLEGGLAQRALLRPLAVPSWPHPEILTNTVVQVLVDANGDVQSQTLLATCGSKEADQAALKLAAGSQFQAIPRNGAPPATSSQITWGQLIFRWHTISPATTNTTISPILR